MNDTAPEPASPPDDTNEPTRDELAAFRRDLTECVRLEARLAAASHGPQLRRVGVDALGTLAVGLALIAAVALINVAILLALAIALPAWAAALILAAAWIVVAAVTAAVIAGHGASLGRLLRRGRSTSTDELHAARDRAWQAVQRDLERLAPPLTDRVIDVAVPIAARVAAQMEEDAAGDVVEDVVDDAEDVGRALIKESEEVVEELAEDVPGARIVNTVWDLALLPGRAGIRVVATVLKRPPSGD